MSIVTLLKPDDLVWPVGSQDQHPYYHVGAGSYGRRINVDPWPGYAVDLELAKTLFGECCERFPLSQAKVSLYLLSHEELGRLNGVTYHDCIYRHEDGSEWEDALTCYCGCGEKYKLVGQALTIVLSAKRIPVHPAMARYLITHEYGHAAFHYVARHQGYRDQDEAKLEEEYMQMRGGSRYEGVYCGGKWHLSTQEVIANDFRVAVMGREAEFWPHPGVEPPNDAVGEWWEHALDVEMVTPGAPKENAA